MRGIRRRMTVMRVMQVISLMWAIEVMRANTFHGELLALEHHPHDIRHLTTPACVCVYVRGFCA